MLLHYYLIPAPAARLLPITHSARDMGACEVYPQSLLHNCNGHFIVVCGDGEYIIYTSQALRNKVP